MSNVLEQIAALDATPAAEYLQSLQEHGRSTLSSKTWPTRKTESWKYTSLRSVEQGDYFQRPGDALQPSTQVEPASNSLAQHFSIPDFAGYSLVFVNGRLDLQLSDIADLPSGATVVAFSQASTEQQSVIQKHLNSVAESDKHLFAAVNNRLLTEGAFLHIEKNVVLDKPVQMVWLSSAAERTFQIAQRLLVVLEDNAEATVIEHFTSTDVEQTSLTHGVTELCLAAGARCHHYRLQLEESHALHIGGVYASLGRNAHLNSFHMALGSTLKRIDIVVNHDGEGAHCNLNGVYLPNQDQHVDYHTCIEHRVPQCTTAENFRGIVGGNGRAVFNGRIHIHPNAQKTLAQLSNKNLLTSNKAEVDTKPELEIYADDVQCAHGATVARLDETAMHYFRTRGVSAKEAEVMLSFGFINELVNGVRHTAVADYLRPMLARLFARDPKLTRHIL